MARRIFQAPRTAGAALEPGSRGAPLLWSGTAMKIHSIGCHSGFPLQRAGAVRAESCWPVVASAFVTRIPAPGGAALSLFPAVPVGRAPMGTRRSASIASADPLWRYGCGSPTFTRHDASRDFVGQPLLHPSADLAGDGGHAQLRRRRTARRPEAESIVATGKEGEAGGDDGRRDFRLRRSHPTASSGREARATNRLDPMTSKAVRDRVRKYGYDRRECGDLERLAVLDPMICAKKDGTKAGSAGTS